MDGISVFALIAGLVLAALGVAALFGAQMRLRKQSDELRALSVLSQLLRANMSTDALLNMVYLQTAQLIEMDSFLAALYEQTQLTYPLFIRQGEQEPAPAYPGDKALIEHVLRTRKPLLLQSDAPEDAKRLQLPPLEAPVQSWLGAPLLAGVRTLGAIVVTSNSRQFGPKDVRMLNIVASNTSIALHNLQFYSQQAERVRQMAALNNILSMLTGTLSPNDVLDTVISSASVIADATGVAVYMLWDDRTMALVRCAGFSEQFVQNAPDPLLVKQPNLEGIHQRKPVIVYDMQRDERTEHLRPIMSREGKAAWIELPLSIGGVHAGALIIYFDRPYPFTEEKIELLRTFANQVAQAMNNARLYTLTDQALEQRVGQLMTLATAGQELIAVTDLDVIYRLILDHALEATGASNGAIVLCNDREAWVAAQHGYPPNAFELPGAAREGITGRVLRTGEIARCDYVSDEADYLALIPSTQAQLSVPIRRGETILGVITLESDQPQAFSEEDTHFILQLANQMVIAVDNAHLIRDVTEARDRLQVILDNMEEAIVLINPNGQIALANPRVSLLGFRPGDLLGQRVDDLLKRRELAFAERLGFSGVQNTLGLIEALHKTGGPAVYTIERERRSVHLERQVIPVRDEAAVSILLVFRDQTEQREVELMREELSRMIVHDLRSPLTAVNTGLKLLRDLVPADSQFSAAVETTTEASQRAIRKLLSRVESLLDISKIESGQLTLEIGPTDLRGLVDSVFTELGPLAQELAVSLVADVPNTVVQVDGEKIERVLLNLVDNALKFSPAESSVTVRTGGVEKGFVRVDVIDAGPGIPDEYKMRLFDRFVQIQGRQGKRRGTGLGLTFCRLAIQAHGGRIWIEDNPPGGSVFAFTLPLSIKTKT
jgi:PAS domain S-box-containing protein